MGIIEKRKKRNDNIRIVCERTGWSKAKAASEFKYARSIGISAGRYIARHLHDLNHDELVDFAEQMEIADRQKQELKEYYADLVSKKSGWSYEKAMKEMLEAEKKGIVFYKYAICEAWAPGEGEMEKWLIKGKEKQENAHDNNEMYFQHLCERTGWSRGKAELEHARIVNNCGASKSDVLIMAMYNMTPEQQRTYVTHRIFNKLRTKYNSHQVSRVYFKDKSKFNETFKDYIVRKWFITEGMSFDEYKENIKGLDKVIVKPLDESQGRGIEVFTCNVSDEEDRRNYDQIMLKGPCMVEQYIVQHKELMEMCPNAVNTVRIATMYYEGRCDFLFAALRIGNEDIVDNFHAGGVAASIDLDTGEIITDAFDAEGNRYEGTPATGKKVKGFVIPYWDQVKHVCEQVTGMIEGVNLVGWDFAITPDGVDLIEGNAELGHGTMQAPGMPGIADRVIKPYM